MAMPIHSKKLNEDEVNREMEHRRRVFEDSLTRKDPWGYVARNNAKPKIERTRQVAPPSKGFFVGLGGC